MSGPLQVFVWGNHVKSENGKEYYSSFELNGTTYSIGEGAPAWSRVWRELKRRGVSWAAGRAAPLTACSSTLPWPFPAGDAVCLWPEQPEAPPFLGQVCACFSIPGAQDPHCIEVIHGVVMLAVSGACCRCHMGGPKRRLGRGKLCPARAPCPAGPLV